MHWKVPDLMLNLRQHLGEKMNLLVWAPSFPDGPKVFLQHFQPENSPLFAIIGSVRHEFSPSFWLSIKLSM